jgi:hypothetical protein
MAKMTGGLGRIDELREKVRAAQQEFDMAITFHEMWKPAAYDKDLHARMGTSYATQAFLIARTALRRETVLALMRLWDRGARAIGMPAIADAIQSKDVMDSLSDERAARMGIPDAAAQIRADLDQKANTVLRIVAKYRRGASHGAVLEKLRSLRNERLAHRQAVRTAAPGIDITDQEVEEFYHDNSQLIQILLSLIDGMAYDPKDSESVYRRYAGYFWAAACGERTEGHPNYRPARMLGAT